MNHLYLPRTLLVAGCFCLGSLASAVAVAEPTPAELTVARRIYSEAVQHEQAKEWPQAEERLRKVLEIKATPGVLYHLAHALEQQGKLVEALLNYDRAHELIASGVKAPDVQRLLGPRVKELKARVPNLTVVVTEEVGSLEIDGQAVGVSLIGSPFPIDPGPHAISVRTPDGRTFAQTFNAVEGQQVEVKPTFPDAPVAAAGSPAPAAPEGKAAADGAVEASAAVSAPAQTEADTPWWGYAFAGGAVAAAGVSVYSFLKADDEGQQAHTFAQQCLGAADAACESSKQAGDRRDTAVLIGFIGAGAAVGFGALATWQLWPSPTDDQTGLRMNFSTRF